MAIGFPGKVVVLHAARPTSRHTTMTHLASFRRHLSGADVRYLHFAQPLPPDLDLPSVDLLVVNYDFLNYRFTPLWPFIRNRWRDLAERAAFRVAVPQDDFWASRLLDSWCVNWRIDRVLTPLDSGLDSIYVRSMRRADFRTVLTGYIDGSIYRGPALRERPIDLGQRVRRMPPHLGRYGQEKAAQAMSFGHAARAAGFTVDVSDRNEDAFLGESWCEFLRSCKFTVGMKGGASRIDPLGMEYLRVQRYIARRPDAGYEEVATRSLRGREVGEMTAISPRLLESAATGTCQILPFGDYLGILEPSRHYIPLERDFSNVDSVLDQMRNLDGAEEMATATHNILVESGRFTDESLVTVAVEGCSPRTARSQPDVAWMRFVSALEYANEVWVGDGPTAHDAVQEAVRWLVDRGVDPESLRTRKHSSFQPDAVGLEVVLRYIRESDRWEWFRTILEWSRLDATFRRSPWTWRPV